MANRRKEIPSFVSIEVGVARSIAEAMNDDEWGKWSKKALDDLSIGCTRKDTDVRVRNLYEKSKENMDKEYLRKKEWYEKRKEGAANRNNADESTTAFENLGSAKPSTDGDTREGSLDEKSGTSANHCGPRQAKNGDASHREAEDESATVSNPFALDMPRQDKASNPRGYNTGNVPPSHGLEEGKIHDQETASGNYQEPDKVSINNCGADAVNRKTTVDSKSSTSAPLRPWKEVVEKSLGMTGNGKRRAGGISPLSVSTSSSPSARSGAVDVLNLAYAGEFGNVTLTQEQYAQLGIKFGNQQKLNRAIDSLSCQIENGERNPQNHYAELVKWANYRDDMEEKKEEEAGKPKMTEMEKSWIAAMKRVEAM